MRTLGSWTVRVLLALGLLAWAAPAFGYPSALPSFDQAIHEAYVAILEGRGPQPVHAERPSQRRADVLRTSERIFAADPETAKTLAHLRAIEASDAPDVFPPARDLLTSDDSGLAALVGVSVYWHEAQHRYDRRQPYRAEGAELADQLPMPIEMERRGWEAGCRVWKSGIGLLIQGGGQSVPGLFCEDRFPQVNYCRLYFSSEIVVLTARQLEALGRPRERVVADLALGPGASPSPFEKILGVYCAEFERARRGNPLDLEGFQFQWSTEECVDKAVAEVSDPAWKSSAELCGSSQTGGADARAAAGELKAWK